MADRMLAPGTLPSELDVSANARAIPQTRRADMLQDMAETELHKHLQVLLQRMMPDAVVEITHGTNEYGKDLVFVDDEPLGKRVGALVVKVGNVGGKTAGVVDEIKSQIDQALKHPVKLPGETAPLSVKQVYVVIAGHVSQNANERLEKEVPGTVQGIWGLDRLVDLFTQHYPEIFFEGRAVSFLQRRISELETHHIFAEVSRNKTLSECFVDPVVATVESMEELEQGDGISIERLKRIPFFKLHEFVNRSRRILLVGCPGSGKSVALARMALDIMKDAFKKLTRDKPKERVGIPILLSARRLAEYYNCVAMLQDQLGDAADSGRFFPLVLMVDGLDEVAADQRQRTLRQAETYASELRCSLIVTSRLVDIVKTPIQGFQRVELTPFGFEQARRLFERIVPDAATRNSLNEGLDLIQGQMDMTPLSLILLVEVVRQYHEVPASVTELYDRYFDHALGRWDDKNKGIRQLFDYQVKRVFLAELAFEEFYKKDRLVLPKSDFDLFLRTFGDRYKWDVEGTREFIVEMDRAGIVRVDDEIEFQHRSFLDFFAAEWVFRGRESVDDLEGFLERVYFEPVWSDIAFFYVGMRREMSVSLMTRVFAHPDVDLGDNVMKFMFGRLLQAGWLSTWEVKVTGIQSALGRAPVLESQFLEMIKADKIPQIVTDFFLLALARMSFSSTFLLKPGTSLVHGMIHNPDYESVRAASLLLWALRTRLPEEELKACVREVFEAVTTIKGMEAGKQARLLNGLILVETGDKELTKNLRRRLDRVLNRHPELKRAVPLRKPKPLPRRRGKRAA